MGLESDNCGYGFASLAMNLYLKNLNEIIKKLNQVINLNLKTNHNLINQKNYYNYQEYEQDEAQ